ncbi:FixH family protein [Ferrovibrio sp. MS7]|jgi:nitrogen fixation protein FixH|uniref:FixH family protein n=1 Tax=Ferrovibrio plantarum TaxID=3119164 RepID=UPI0031374F3A
MENAKSFLKQRWIPSLFVFGFLVVIAVNATLITFATKSFSGLVVEHPYKKGIEYTQMQQSLEGQKALHWKYRLSTESQPDGGLRLVLTWQDQAGLALSGLAIALEAERPVENMPAIQARMLEVAGGRYEAVLHLPRQGVWNIGIEAQRDGQHFLAAERIVVK